LLPEEEDGSVLGLASSDRVLAIGGFADAELVKAAGGFAELVEAAAGFAEELVEAAAGFAKELVDAEELVEAAAGFAEELVDAEALVVVVAGCKFMPWSLNPELEPLPLCLCAAPRLNCSMKAPNCSLPELERTTEWENLERRTHE
jgi:hypothetical protein